MEPMVGLVAGVVLGVVGGAIWGYTQNWIAGVFVLGIGMVVLFGISSGGPGTIVQNFMDKVGIVGIIAVAAGAAGGWYVADRERVKPRTS